MSTKAERSAAASILAKKRAKKLTPERRKEIARMGGLAGGNGRPKKIASSPLTD